jgi:hypothetical protein
MHAVVNYSSGAAVQHSIRSGDGVGRIKVPTASRCVVTQQGTAPEGCELA